MRKRSVKAFRISIFSQPLIDRILVNEGKPQIYGTQITDEGIPYPIEEEEHVNARRSEMGLCTLEEYLEWIPKKDN